ncbi:secreted RxLR effector protein 161-like [Ricinus communis]|uniref:secreted RxLR effector protein 161-like n=1 Tax=Ricinus communis TaxID=3988 RepID=UPI00201A3113|nr:secreted RxLR effector protein 161-like [Ricinus communis]
MDNCNPVQNPIVRDFRLTRDENGARVDSSRYKQLIGSLMYLAATRPNIMFVVSLLSRYMEQPTELHFQVAKRVLRYIKGTSEFGIFYKRGGDAELIAFTDSDYAGDSDDRRSTSGFVFLLNSGVVSWSSKKQPIVTLSTTEAEFVAAAACACQAVCSAGALSKNPVLHGRSKYIDVRFHFLHELTKDGVVKLVHCGAQEQVADIMTKPLKLDLFIKFRSLLGVCAASSVN